MGWVESLRGSIVALDTAPLIYFIEEHPIYFPHVRPFFDLARQGEILIVTSVLTLTEALVRPIRLGDAMLIARYQFVLAAADEITVLAVTEVVAEEAARLRAHHGLRTPDAVQLATATHAGATAFLTNDARLRTAWSNVIVLNDFVKM